MPEDALEDAEVGHFVKDAADMVADGHMTGTDHAEHLAYLCASQIMRKLPSFIQSICTAAAVTTWTAHS